MRVHQIISNSRIPTRRLFSLKTRTPYYPEDRMRAIVAGTVAGTLNGILYNQRVQAKITKQLSKMKGRIIRVGE